MERVFVRTKAMRKIILFKYGAIPTLKSIDMFKGAQCPGDIGSAPTEVERRD